MLLQMFENKRGAGLMCKFLFQRGAYSRRFPEPSASRDGLPSLDALRILESRHRCRRQVWSSTT